MPVARGALAANSDCEILRMVMTYKEQMTRLREQRDQTYGDVLDLLKRACPGVGHPSFNRISASWNWECEASPVGVCVYNELDDPAHDYCLYCEGPEERK